MNQRQKKNASGAAGRTATMSLQRSLQAQPDIKDQRRSLTKQGSEYEKHQTKNSGRRAIQRGVDAEQTARFQIQKNYGIKDSLLNTSNSSSLQNSQNLNNHPRGDYDNFEVQNRRGESTDHQVKRTRTEQATLANQSKGNLNELQNAKSNQQIPSEKVRGAAVHKHANQSSKSIEQISLGTEGAQTNKIQAFEQAIVEHVPEGRQAQVVQFSSVQTGQSNFRQSMGSSNHIHEQSPEVIKMASQSQPEFNLLRKNDNEAKFTGSRKQLANERAGNREIQFNTEMSANNESQIINNPMDTQQSMKLEAGQMSQQVDVHSITEQTQLFLKEAGYELMAWGPTSLYNQLIQRQGLNEELSPLPDDKLLIVAGNNKSIWNKINEFQQRSRSQNPFDDYSRETSSRISKHFNLQGLKTTVVHTNEYTQDKLVSFTRLIQSLSNGDGGKCFYQPLIHLLFHEEYGNWHTWRFALIFDNVTMKHDARELQLSLQAEEVKLQKQILPVEVQMAASLMEKVSSLEEQQDRTNPKQSISEEISILSLKIRQAFLLGRDEWMFPKEMLRYHYGDVPKRFFDSKNLSASSIQNSQTPNVRELNVVSETDNKTATNYDQDEFDDVSDVLGHPGKKSEMTTEQLKNRRSSINSPDEEAYSDEFEEILSDEQQLQVNKNHDQFHQPFHKLGNIKELIGKAQSPRGINRKSKDIFEQSPPQSQKNGDTPNKLEPKAQTIDHYQTKKTEPVNQSFTPQETNDMVDEIGRLIAATKDDSLLSENPGSNIYSPPIKEYQLPVDNDNTIMIHDSQKDQRDLKSEKIKDDLLLQKGDQEAADPKYQEHDEGDPYSIKDWTIDQNDEQMFMSELQTNTNWIGIKRQQQPMPSLNQYTNDNKSSILSLQKQRMIKRFYDYNYQSQDMRGKAALRHQFINRRGTQYNNQLVSSFKDTKFTNMQAKTNRVAQDTQNQTLYHQSMPSSEQFILQNQERQQNQFVMINDNEQYDSIVVNTKQSPSRSPSMSPKGARKKENRNVSYNTVNSRGVNFISSMRKTNIRFPFGYGKKNNTQTIRQQNESSANQMPNGAGVLETSNSPYRGQLQTQKVMGSQSQAQIDSVKLRNNLGQNFLKSGRFYGKQNRSNTQYFRTREQIQNRNPRPTNIPVRDFIQSELHKRGQSKPENSSTFKSVSQVGTYTDGQQTNLKVNQGIFSNYITPGSQDSLQKLDSNRQLQKVTSQPIDSKFVVFNSKIRTNQDSLQCGSQDYLKYDNFSFRAPNENQNSKTNKDAASNKQPLPHSLDVDINWTSIGQQQNEQNFSSSIQALSQMELSSKDLFDRLKFTYSGISREDILKKSTSEIMQKIKQNMRQQKQNLHAQKIIRLTEKISNAQKFLRLQQECQIAWQRAQENESYRPKFEELNSQLKLVGENIDTSFTELSVLEEQSTLGRNRLSYSNLEIDNFQQGSDLESKHQQQYKEAEKSTLRDPYEIYQQKYKIKNIDIKQDLLSYHKSQKNELSEKTHSPFEQSQLKFNMDTQRLKKIYKSTTSVQLKQGLAQKFSKQKQRLTLNRRSGSKNQENYWTEKSRKNSQNIIELNVNAQKKVEHPSFDITQRKKIDNKSKILKDEDPEISYGDGDLNKEKQREGLQTAPANRSNLAQEPKFSKTARQKTDQQLSMNFESQKQQQQQPVQSTDNSEFARMMSDIDKEMAQKPNYLKQNVNVQDFLMKRQSSNSQKKQKNIPIYQAPAVISNKDLQSELANKLPYSLGVSSKELKAFASNNGKISKADYQTMSVPRYLDQTMGREDKKFEANKVVGIQTYTHAAKQTHHLLPSFYSQREDIKQMKEDIQRVRDRESRRKADSRKDFGKIYGVTQKLGLQKNATQQQSRIRERPSNTLIKEAAVDNRTEQHQGKRNSLSRQDNHDRSKDLQRSPFEKKGSPSKSISPSLYENLKATQKAYKLTRK